MKEESYHGYKIGDIIYVKPDDANVLKGFVKDIVKDNASNYSGENLSIVSSRSAKGCSRAYIHKQTSNFKL